MNIDIINGGSELNILFLDAYFFPEKIAFSHLEKDLIEALVKEEQKLHIITPVPTRGVSEQVRKQYCKIKKETYANDKVDVLRFWAPVENRNPITRAFRYIWCNLRQYQLASKYKNIDTIFSVSTPPTQGMISAMVAKKLSKKYRKKVSFIYNLQDVFPDSLANVGMTKKGSFMWKIGRKIEDYTYRNADKIIVISNSMKKNIMNKGVNEDKIAVISNWIDVEEIKPVERNENTLISEFSIDPRKFIVVYAGNFGAAQGADIVLKVAEKLQEYNDIQFVIFGGGSYFEDAKKYVSDRNLNNVIINSLLPQERVSEVYSLGDVALITCKTGTGKAGMPSKTWSIMACNTPIVASFDIDSELGEVLNESQAGTIVEPENEEMLSKAIIEAYEKSKGKTFCRKFVEENASKERCVAKYIESINDLLYHNKKKSLNNEKILGNR